MKKKEPAPIRPPVQDISQLFDEYAYTMQTLEAFDRDKLQPNVDTSKKCQPIDYNWAQDIIAQLKQNLQKKQQASDFFGRESKKESLKASLEAVHQSFDGQDLYPGLEEKAAHLIYLIIKNRPFVDGNKCIGAFLFVVFLHINKINSLDNGLMGRVGNNELIHLALLIAKSDPREKSNIIKLIISLINSCQTSLK